MSRMLTFGTTVLAVSCLSFAAYAEETPKAEAQAPALTENMKVEDSVVVAMVDKAAAEIEKDTPGTFAKISASDPAFYDKSKDELYTFVYDTEVTAVAHPDKNLIGKSLKGKPDPKGKKFRDEIVAGALKDGSGWIEYVKTKPGVAGLFQKKVYYKLAKGSDGKQYVVAAGKYLEKK